MRASRYFFVAFLLSLATPFTFAQSVGVKAGPFAVEVLVQGPANTKTNLQVICLFRSDPSNKLHGSLIEINQKLDGLLDLLRTPARGPLFAGELGETLLIAPKRGTISGRLLLIVGLGDSHSFTPARMNLVGYIVFAEANRLRIKHPFFAPTVLDGGVSGFNTGDIAEQFIRGFLQARETESTLKSRGVSPGKTVDRLTFLAGETHAADTQAGIERVSGIQVVH